jgi:Na+-transporting methylmalonyl-CoA/oxaloacetate decarboxylase gamma subunit
MDVFTQALQISAIGMVLVFMSLLIVAALIWALDRLFRPAPAAAAPAAPRPKPSAVIAQTSGGDPVTATSSARHAGSEAQAAALAVAIVRARMAAQSAGQRIGSVAAVRARMPWERPLPVCDEIPEAETVTVITVNPGPANWKAQGRLKAME